MKSVNFILVGDLKVHVRIAHEPMHDLIVHCRNSNVESGVSDVVLDIYIQSVSVVGQLTHDVQKTALNGNM